ncbi:MAG TPA: KamA family radical SAM protein [Syntrophorhabdaceae bacterium]|mgnify:CR=1 FL=1|nr:KamA family radical SAM protein [Syntrophorhabdaceae bacterium]HPU29017.1 KamA family radical SAM protein [Syntrophorhabdaceae bacterium]
MKEKEGRKNALPFICDIEELKKRLSLSEKKAKEIEETARVYPFRIPEFYLNLIEKEKPACPIKKQCIPDIKELSKIGDVDPLIEEKYSITPSFIKKYPGRGVFLSGTQCAMFCRFCNRKRLIGKDHNIKESHKETFNYLEKDKTIKEVIISGGDPLTLPLDEFDYILMRLARIPHIKILRISTRMPVVYPDGIDKRLIDSIKAISPLYFIIHINHPKEITEEFSEIVKKLRNAGCILLSHTVLLRGVNDCPFILKNLFEGLIMLGVKPYYLFQVDEVKGVAHFKVGLKKGIEIMKLLRRELSGIALPTYVIDITGGAGKIPVDYSYIKKRSGKKLLIEDLYGNIGHYTDDGKRSICSGCNICGKKRNFKG